MDKTELQKLLPPKMWQLSMVIGLEDTLELINRYANQRLYIPTKNTGKFAFLSEDAQAKLRIRYGGTLIDVPQCKTLKNAIRDKEIKERRINGAIVVRLSHEYGVTRQWIHKIING
ncbi:Mor transcription activator family protein [Beggiatoa leptomitoformis]|uniref:Mor transcription activator domain-containing protein n=1 Tax=Beggiatoa leptomitoformis TaxID=288004 RepID=A0A2N9YH57_9GAMM|nr:Mor transcription activator family protein [Beggiatoa leptomitoformis]ALG67880.1 hypothetical protein AL038_09360 [Beggiatoa leptomitoformis]AUI69858.1 hypothetical protein BLE401_14940 [Beggiatoa leptomitoformis]